MVIFGVSGDLTKRKLIPSLYHLAKKELLPKEFALLGCAMRQISEDEFRKQLRADLGEFGGNPKDCKFCDWLIERTYYLRAISKIRIYQSLNRSLEGMDEEARYGRKLLLLPGYRPAACSAK